MMKTRFAVIAASATLSLLALTTCSTTASPSSAPSLPNNTISTPASTSNSTASSVSSTQANSNSAVFHYGYTDKFVTLEQGDTFGDFTLTNLTVTPYRILGCPQY